MGLVEFGVGLIPGGGGSKEFAKRLSDELHAGDIKINRLRDRFLTVGQAKVSMSAYEAFDLGYLREGIDEVVVSRDYQLTRAKAACLELANKGYIAPKKSKNINVLGQEGLGIVYVIVEGWGTNMGAFDIAINANYLALDEYDLADVTLFPNPTRSTFKLDGIAGAVKVMDLSGQELLTIQTYQGELIDMSAFSEGVYLIRFEKNGLKGTKKLILTK
jgi:enoyl-CoA hydratase/carnithine racemase